ncbi:MAG: bifunctional (p)ppGpp synthetase/guanosine-3',5'-bis(diphosphate) 3'-pyrophosphohydrolase [Anaerolineae bacterium]|jgi:GTP pyrophosphokinase|nr:bifunctional (p)ppGpp synthetase/guanosine-3',5'-bis(diphosphate) 3'-pyrophosphohydrolase [Anaerolineae bacterium]MBT3714761.1 bifunctional (p)ppGpp synthetase/guanosine-3',5'-bis(diphosphate) 3'-pyrophosphohydrolase [Anaerolineae bacterium]MBT4309343.1 bifunctional (p)ppGpp synthetase/guanosine-3',5'-bis(diphosphate) 3'-pyrophosphohydrolase [Anaerolineae bacterium]MBT4458172.1 bifunctional (p)ppGpp synthetase/guanosine-3',5'-bis(diphosphate) 3'-pyrophosphohydrolase [Anaerolineae bacterium]M
MKSTTVAVTINGLLEQLPSYYSPTDKDLIQRAYRIAEEAHRPQKRASGEPYVMHCLAVASILAELQVPPAAVAAGLLHDTVEDTEITLEDLQRDFGGEITNLVDGVTKLTNLPRVSRDDQHAEQLTAEIRESGQKGSDAEESYPKPALLGRSPDMASETLRKTFLAMDNDIRVVLIKLADRLHNMRTLGFMPEHKRKRIAKQTLEIFAPLANRMGIWQVKWELEDLSFRHTNPEEYKEIASHLTARRKLREDEIKTMVVELKKMFKREGIDAKVFGRPKHIYSIYRKMLSKNKPFEMVRDVRAIRVLVPDVPSCYSSLGLIHTRWRPLPNEFDDYIAAPKENFYQSLHTAVIYEDGKPLEIQIRTDEMHANAEFGIASHWQYKEGGNGENSSYNQRIDDIRRMMEWQTDVSDATEFVESMKTDVFQDRVYIFTPNGDIIDLPAGSTPIDFAYHIHTDVGHRCRGAKVNGKLVSLSYELKTGEQVHILTAKRGGPSRDWLNANLGLVKTQRAKSKMRVWFRKQNREQNITQGRTLLEKELQRVGVKEKTNFEKLAREMGYRSVEDLSLALGHGDLSVNAIIPQLPDDEQEMEEILPSTRPSASSTDATDAINVVGLKGLLTNIAKCCNPTPGDEIIGYITRGRGATIHRSDCPNILRTNDRERLVKVAWGALARTYPVPIRVSAFDRSGLFGDITYILSNASINIIDAKVKVDKGVADIQLVIEVSDIKELSSLLARIENIPNVLEAQRDRPG